MFEGLDPDFRVLHPRTVQLAEVGGQKENAKRPKMEGIGSRFLLDSTELTV